MCRGSLHERGFYILWRPRRSCSSGILYLLQHTMGGSSTGGDDTSSWLHRMSLFCGELQEFLATVPSNASLQSCAAMDEATSAKYPRMAEACDAGMTQYMPGINYAAYRDEVQAVYSLGVQTCCMLNAHPALGVFQGIPETKVELFFERPLNMCMALGAEHGLTRMQYTHNALMREAAAAAPHPTDCGTQQPR